MSDAKFYYVRHDVELGEATRECDCSKPCQKVVKADDYNALVLRLDTAEKKAAAEYKAHDEALVKLATSERNRDFLRDQRDDLQRRLNSVSRLASDWIAESHMGAGEQKYDCGLAMLTLLQARDVEKQE